MALFSKTDDRGPPGWVGTWPVAALVVLLAAAYAPLFSGRLLFHRDVSRFLHPIRWFVKDSLGRGDWPWWNPHVGLGHSMLADPQSALFYPVNLLHLVGPLPFTMMLVMLLHLGWGALGMMRVARAFHLREVPALLAGLAWALSGYIASLWTNGARLPSAAWIPWQIMACLAVARATWSQPIAAPVALTAMATAAGILAGDFFVAAMGASLGPALAIAWLVGEADAAPSRRQPRRQLVAGATRTIAWIMLGSLLGAMVSMASVLPSLLAVAGTERASGFSLAAAEGGSLHPMRLIELVAPEAFARAWFRAPTQDWVGRYLDGAPLSFSIYAGGAVLALVALAIGRGRTGRDRTTGQTTRPSRLAAIAVAVIAGGFLLLAFGRHTPAFALWRGLLYPLRYMRAPEKYLLAVVPCVALLAGWGAHRLLDRERSLPWRAALLVPAVVAGLLLLAPAVLPTELASQVRGQAWQALAGALLVLLAGLLAGRRPVVAAVVLVVVVVVDLVAGSTFTLRFDDASVPRKPALAKLLQPSDSPALPFPRLFRGNKVQHFAGSTAEDGGNRATVETLRENLGVPLGVASLPGYGVAIAPALTELLARGRLDALRLLAVDFALLSAPAGKSSVPEGLDPIVTPFPALRLYKMATALPRAYLAFESKTFPAAELPEHLLDPDVVAGKTVLLEAEHGQRDDARLPLPAGEAGQPPVACTLDGYRTNQLQATCNAPTPAIAVFVEQYAKGWHATVDHAPAQVVRANGMMRAVFVPAGRHTIRLVYSPPGLRAGAVMSLAGLALVLTLFAFARWRARRPPSSSDILVEDSSRQQSP